MFPDILPSVLKTSLAGHGSLAFKPITHPQKDEAELQFSRSVLITETLSQKTEKKKEERKREGGREEEGRKEGKIKWGMNSFFIVQ